MYYNSVSHYSYIINAKLDYFLMNYWQIYNLKNNDLLFEDEAPVSQADFKSQETLTKELQQKVLEQEFMYKNILQKYNQCKDENKHQSQKLHHMILVIAFLCLNSLLILLLSLFIPLHNSNKFLIQMYDAVIFTHMYTLAFFPLIQLCYFRDVYHEILLYISRSHYSNMVCNFALCDKSP